MVERCGIKQTFKIRYSFSHIQWLLGAVSVSALLFLSSDSIDKIWTGLPFSQVFWNFLAYVSFFFLALFAIHYYDSIKVTSRKTVAFSVSMLTVLADITIVMFCEWLVSFSLNALSQGYLITTAILLLGAMPVCLGSIVLSSVNAESLKKQSKALLDEAQKLAKEIERLESKEKEAKTNLEHLIEKEAKFKKYFSKQKSNSRDEKSNEQ